MITSSPQTKRRVFKPGAGNSQRYRRHPTARHALSTSTSAKVLDLAWQHWDVHPAKVFGRCEVKSGIAPVDRLVSEVMSQEPYKSARCVFWIMHNCSAHRGQKAANRLRDKWPNAILIHTPGHASWLHPIEIYFLHRSAEGSHTQRFLFSG
jgi:hypothetical protein